MLISLLLTIVLGFFIGPYIPTDTIPFVSVVNGTEMTSIFSIAFVLSSALFYFLSYREKEDILTPLRKSLQGTWRIEYQAWRVEGDGSIRDHNAANVCSIKIDEGTAKLYLTTRTVSSRLYEADELRIDDISINPAPNPQRISYYQDMVVRLKSGSMQELNRTNSEVRAPIFVIASFDKPMNKESIRFMSGHWYDLDGTFAQLERSLAERNGVSVRGEVPRSGEITFERVE